MIFNCIGGGGGGSAKLKLQSWYGTAPKEVVSSYAKPQDPSQTGYVFGGWYADPEYATAYDWSAQAKSGTAYAKWSIAQPTVNKPASLTYDGTAKALGTVVAKGDGQTVEYSLDGTAWTTAAPTATAAGTYAVRWRVTADHVEALTGEYSVEVAGAKMSVTATDKSATYNGAAVTANAVTVTNPTSGYTLRYGTAAGAYTLTAPPSFTDAGEHVVYYQVTAPNFATATGSYKVSIAKSSAGLTISPTSLTVKEADGGTGTITVKRNGNGAITATSSATGKATVSVSGTTVTVKYVGAGSATVTVSVAASANYLAATATCLVTTVAALEIVSWASGTDAQIAAMVAAADAGTIKLSDHWHVGDTRKVQLSAMAATGVGETHVAQQVEMVLMHAGGKMLSNGKECSFVVGQKNFLANGTSGEYGYMNSSNTNANGWDGCARRTWCNSVYRNAVPSSLRGIFKQFNNVTAAGTGTATKTSVDWFALPSEKEVFGGTTYANATAEASNIQFDWYKAAANRVKKAGANGSAGNWWERSPLSSVSGGFCVVLTDGTAYNNPAGGTRGLAPFGCI